MIYIVGIVALIAGFIAALIIAYFVLKGGLQT